MKHSRALVVLAGASIALAACGSSSAGGGPTGCSNPTYNGMAPASNEVAQSSALANAAATSNLPVTVAGSVIPIGFQGMLSGDLKNYGVDELNGVQLAVDEANAAGGITFGGKHYTLKADGQDDLGATAQGGQTAAAKLKDDGVVAVVGGVFSTATIAGQKIYHDNGLAQISPSATRTNYTDDQVAPITSFRTIGRDDQQGPLGADVLVKNLGCHNIAVVDDKSTYGAGLADHAADQIPKDGGVVVDREHVTAGAGGDFRSQLTTIKGKHVDAIYYGGYSREAGPFKKQAKDLGLNIPMAGGDGWQDADFSALAGTSGDGAYATNGGPAASLLTAFNAKYKAKFNQDIFQYAPEAYDATNIIINAIKKVGPDPAAIVAEIRNTKDYAGVTGKISFNSKGDLTISVFTLWKYDSTCTSCVPKNWKPIKAVSTNNPTT
jgi:branched-chain amino acid transport system substrate-binding protein